MWGIAPNSATIARAALAFPGLESGKPAGFDFEGC